MTARTLASNPLGDLPVTRRHLAHLSVLAALVVLAILAAQVSLLLFQLVGLAVIGVYAATAIRAPRLALLILIFAPMIDRYGISSVVPHDAQAWTNYLSESLLATASIVLAIDGLRRGTLWPALRHPVLLMLAAFTAIAVVSAFVNGVPTVQAAAGVIFTLDAAALFFLPRIVGFSERQATGVVIAFVAVATGAAVLALMQVYLAPDILGLGTSQGRFGEGARVGAFMDANPNMLGAVLAMAIPFPVFGFFRVSGARSRALLAVVSFVLVLALFFTFSRGAWLGLALATLVVAGIIDRRVILAILLLAALAYGTAHVVPRALLADATSSQLELDLEGATIGRIGAIGAGNDLRTLFIQNALPIIGDHLLVGAGPGRYGGSVSARFGSPLWNEYTDGAVPVYRTVDNFWLHILVEAGILGTLALIGALLAAGWQLLRAAARMHGMARVIETGCLIAGITLAVDSVTEMLLEGNTTSFALWFLLGVGSALAVAGRPASTTETDGGGRGAAIASSGRA